MIRHLIVSTIAVVLAAMLLVPAAVFAACIAHDATGDRSDRLTARTHPDGGRRR